MSDKNKIIIDISRQKAIAGKIYNIDNVEYIALDTLSGCTVCIAECKPELCNELPLCSSDRTSVIFREV
jgi:hypothetical protein